MDWPLFVVPFARRMASSLSAAAVALLATMPASAQQPRLALVASPGEPLRIVLEGGGAPEPVIDAVGYEATFEDQTPAFKIDSVRSVTDVEGGRRIDFALTGPAAEQTHVSLLVTDVPRGLRMRWTLSYTGEPKGFFPWTTGFRWQYASAIEGASGISTTRWVEPTGAHDWEVVGDAPYPDFECQVRTVRLADRPPFAFVTECRGEPPYLLRFAGYYLDKVEKRQDQWLFTERIIRLWDGAVLARFPGHGEFQPRKRPPELRIKR